MSASTGPRARCQSISATCLSCSRLSLNRVIVPIIDKRAVLHGVRDMNTLRDVSPEATAEQLGMACIPALKFDSISAVVESASKLRPSTAEGHVARYGDWERVKVKSPASVLTALLPRGEDGLAQEKLRHTRDPRSGC